MPRCTSRRNGEAVEAATLIPHTLKASNAAQRCVFLVLDRMRRNGLRSEQARHPSTIVTATARPGLLSQGSYVAPSPQRRIPYKRHGTELTYCPVYGFKLCVICTKGLTPALFCGYSALGRHRYRSCQPQPTASKPASAKEVASRTLA